MTDERRLPPEALDAWLAELTAHLGVDDTIAIGTVLDVARDVAHDVARPAAPLSTFVLGLALGRAGLTGDAGAAELDRLAAAVSELAARHTS
ncbi:DUF6457 domain-containing protein [Agromyces atrinae]|uniref:DUF6457 domain-containing protein n=1 Tax=Agromyces atrinae TaxID=592376 RepID=A0A4Q2M0N8_9MICO|nr:DUF6457 domain-containing protein [Agromyces atrinae]NYD67007.1 hypothetical protein [Agromyces atrinae]RXZ85259.1 hypothetical protein ESP50_16260 [Agromyces atrinae]RXZ85367.1 hypothetical protein ESP50_15665 [Agromyces atrinae]